MLIDSPLVSLASTPNTLEEKKNLSVFGMVFVMVIIDII